MARNLKYTAIRTPYSDWHRKQHDFVAFTDIDKISICPACSEPLLVADLIYNVNNSFKSKPPYTQRIYKIISETLDIPYFEVFYTVDENTENREITEFNLRQIRPYSHIVKKLTPDEWLQYLEWKVAQHSKDCARKEYLLQRAAENKSNNQFTRQNHYVKLLSE